MNFSVLPGEYAIHRLHPNSAIPNNVLAADVFHIFRSNEELSILVPEAVALGSENVESGWSGLRIKDPMDFSMVGVLAEISSTLARAGVSLLAVSTFDTDYLFVKSGSLTSSIEHLRAAGHTIQ